MKLTKKERLSILKSVLGQYEKGIARHGAICSDVADAVEDEMRVSWVSNSEAQELFPELMKHRPNNKAIGGFWWPEGINRKRIQVLKSMIAEIEKK